MFWCSEVNCSHDLANTTAFCIWCEKINDRISKKKTNRRHEEDHPGMPAQYPLQNAFRITKKFCVANRYQSCEKRSNPKRNSRQQTPFNSFVEDQVKNKFSIPS